MKGRPGKERPNTHTRRSQGSTKLYLFECCGCDYTSGDRDLFVAHLRQEIAWRQQVLAELDEAAS